MERKTNVSLNGKVTGRSSKKSRLCIKSGKAASKNITECSTIGARPDKRKGCKTTNIACNKC